MIVRWFQMLFLVCAATTAVAQQSANSSSDGGAAFRQFDSESWPSPNVYRSADGSPGPEYWQQKVSYSIRASLDESARSLTGDARITYANNSPDTLRYLWVLLDQNAFSKDSIAERGRPSPTGTTIPIAELRRARRYQGWQGGISRLKVEALDGTSIPFTTVDTLMRVDLPRPLGPGETTAFAISWSYELPETKVVGGRGGYECFPKSDVIENCIFELAQWYPRLAAYSDYEGWHNKAFLGSEYGLEFGDYDVAISVPADHIVAATGELRNPADVLTVRQRARLATARTASSPVQIVTPEEASRSELYRAPGVKTWQFRAENVRDFALASSRKYIWDAMGVKQDYKLMPVVLAMSFYTEEARPLWNAYATKAIAHTIKTYGKFALPYPYPTAQAAFGPVGGMEYPMLTFIGNRPIKDPITGDLSYSEQLRNRFLDNLFHEVGHNWFPMIINTDERQWSWMDEGMSSFLQYQTEKLWDPAFPSRRGEPREIAPQMLTQPQSAIMTQPDSVIDGSFTSYAKPAAAINVLRETVLGPELFDFAFREYARRWRFKRPVPADFFRTMEEASGVDLDWFWRGWFYSTGHVDIAIAKITEIRAGGWSRENEADQKRPHKEAEPLSVTVELNATEGLVAADAELQDFYFNDERRESSKGVPQSAAGRLIDPRPDDERALAANDRFYRFTFQNLGGVVMPIILKMAFADGSSETVSIPAEIWRRNSERVTWQYVTSRHLQSAELDPKWQTADSERLNNRYLGEIELVTLPVKLDREPPNEMRERGLRVAPESLRPLPASPR